MKKNFQKFLKNLEKLEIKNITDLQILMGKIKELLNKIEKKTETIERRLKLIILDNILKSLNQETFVFQIASKPSINQERKNNIPIIPQLRMKTKQNIHIPQPGPSTFKKQKIK